MNLPLQKHEKILFIGDSITDASRSRPIGYSKAVNSEFTNNVSLGSGYVSTIENRLVSDYPQLELELLNLGSNGHRVTDLKFRWQKDVIQHSPDWLVILIGINDVWRQFDRPLDPHQVSVTQFEDIYRELIVSSQVNPNKIVLMTPYYLSTELNCKMNDKMRLYANVVKSLAIELQCLLVDLQSAFDQFLKFRSYTDISNDRVHLNRTGHMIIANSFLNTIKAHLPELPNLGDW